MYSDIHILLRNQTNSNIFLTQTMHFSYTYTTYIPKKCGHKSPCPHPLPPRPILPSHCVSVKKHRLVETQLDTLNMYGISVCVHINVYIYVRGVMCVWGCVRWMEYICTLIVCICTLIVCKNTGLSNPSLTPSICIVSLYMCICVSVCLSVFKDRTTSKRE